MSAVPVLHPASCAHCGQPAAAGARFCCPGCAAAYETICALGFGRYYERREIDPDARALKPEPTERVALEHYVRTGPDGRSALELMVDGLQCGACVWLIESVLAQYPELIKARVNMTTRHLRLEWQGDPALAQVFVAKIEALGYRLAPFRTEALAAATDRTEQELLRALAVAGFAAGNLMLLSIGIWAGFSEGMGSATRALMHWLSAAIALPAIFYAGRPFFRSALAVVSHGRTNMDVPISIGVLLVTGMSLVETMRGGAHTYFDSAATLLFFLLIGRVLDHRARGKARRAAEELIGLSSADVLVLAPDGRCQSRAPEAVRPGERVLVGMGERIGVDGTVLDGNSEIDQSLVTGESLPIPARPGSPVFAGSVNLGAPLTIEARATGDGTLLAECVRLIEAAEQGRGRFVVLADRIARRYAPTVHLAALGTFLGWWLLMGAPWTEALLNASAVLIITCPCALALAVPAVQVIATGKLFRAGILLKSPSALERLAAIDTIVFDKTGTLTQRTLQLVDDPLRRPADLAAAAALAVTSRHPLARALAAAAGPVAIAAGVEEVPGAGLEAPGPDGRIRLGSAAFCGVTAAEGDTPELWLARPGQAPVRFAFAERLRADAAETIAALQREGVTLRLLSGDRKMAVARAAGAAGIEAWDAAQSPPDKVAALAALAAAGHQVLMVGDGLNDGPALAAAAVSMSPSTAADLSQTLADLVFQGERLQPVAQALSTARRARRLIRQNIALSLGYNLCVVPLAVLGLVTPWLAAAAMSSSSLLVILNSFRFGGKETP
jgi:P-type Cu2+ transporter